MYPCNEKANDFSLSWPYFQFFVNDYTSSHINLLEKTSMYQCNKKPNGFSLSWPSICQAKFGLSLKYFLHLNFFCFLLDTPSGSYCKKHSEHPLFGLLISKDVSLLYYSFIFHNGYNTALTMVLTMPLTFSSEMLYQGGSYFNLVFFFI